jgi:HD-GYP domain-containing protein (c-di-GMP phosphodiesterase class II)
MEAQELAQLKNKYKRKEKKLHKLPIKYLWDGLVLKEDIFNHTGKVLLLPKGETVTAAKLQRLVNFDGDDRNIMVYDDTYMEIIMDARVPTEERQKAIETFSGYSDLQDSVENMMQRSGSADWLDSKQMEPLTKQISEKLSDADPMTIFSCINFPRPMDAALGRHSLNVALLNGMQAEWLKMPQASVETAVMAGMLHDIGKTKIPEEILNAPRKLNDKELEVMRMHPVYSYELLEGNFAEGVKMAARHHHEKMDGTGYPDGVSGEDISIYARITAISDIYDAMVSKRSYKGSILPFSVFDMFYREEFQGLDRQLVVLFLKHMRKAYINKQVIMSDGKKAVICYIPPNDSEHPIVRLGNAVRQTDDEWQCKEAVAIF